MPRVSSHCGPSVEGVGAAGAVGAGGAGLAQPGWLGSAGAAVLGEAGGGAHVGGIPVVCCSPMSSWPLSPMSIGVPTADLFTT